MPPLPSRRTCCLRFDVLVLLVVVRSSASVPRKLGWKFRSALTKQRTNNGVLGRSGERSSSAFEKPLRCPLPTRSLTHSRLRFHQRILGKDDNDNVDKWTFYARGEPRATPFRSNYNFVVQKAGRAGCSCDTAIFHCPPFLGRLWVLSNCPNISLT